jgi:polysaccharide export outer membrane protein
MILNMNIYKIWIIGAFLISSCNTQKLFQFGGEQLSEPSSFKPYKHTLQSDDKISVSIWNHDDLSVGSVYGVYNSNEVYGKWVMIDPKGYAKLPVIGDIMLGNLTLEGAKDTLVNIYGKFIKDPVIEIKVLNLQVTILGEVKSPGNYVLEKAENNLIEILGKAGGLDFYADKENIKIIRGNISSGQVTQFYVNLTNMDEITSGKLNLHPNDVIHIPTLKGKLLDKKAPTLVPFASATSAIAVIAALLLKK